MPTCYELWCEAVNLMSEGTAKPSYKTQTLIYLGVASQALARIADALEGAATDGRDAALDEARRRIDNLGFGENGDYRRGVVDALVIIDEIRAREEKGQ